MQEIKIRLKNKKFSLKVKKVSFFGKYFGLMFKLRETDNLLFEFSKNEVPAIHSFFVFFRFLAVWLDEKNNVVDMRVVKPFAPFVSTVKPAKKLVEIPFNKKNKKVLKFFFHKI